MRKFFRSLAFFLLIGSLTTYALAQTYSPSADFDPTPLYIHPVAHTTPRPITALDLLQMRDFKGIQISPDGKSVAYVVSQSVLQSNSYHSALFLIATEPGSMPINLGSAGPPHWNEIGEYLEVDPQWSPDSKYVTYLLKESGTWQIWRWKREGGKPDQLTHNPNDVKDYEWSSDGRQIIFTTVEPINTTELKKIAEQGIIWDGSIRAAQAQPIMQSVINGMPKHLEVWVYDVAAGRERKATAEEESDYNKTHKPHFEGPKPFLTKPSPDGKTTAYISYLDDPKQFPFYGYSLFAKTLSQPTTLQLTPNSPFYIQDLWWNRDGTQIYFVQLTADGRSALFVIPTEGGSASEVTHSKDVLSAFSFENNRARAVCIRENPTTPPELAVVDLRDGVPHTIVNINPEFQNIKLSPASRLEWTNKYGDKTFAHLIKPLDYRAGIRYPLIVTTYRSSGFLRGAVGDEFPIQVFAANGFVVLDFDAPPIRVIKPNDFKNNLLRWTSPMASLETVLTNLDQTGIIDPRRTGITGVSYGAEITEFTITHSDIFQVAADGGPSARDPLFYYLSFNTWHKKFAAMLGGWPEGEAAPNWKELSPALNTDKLTAPLLTQTADSGYLPGMQFYTAMNERAKPFELFIYPGEEHITMQPTHRFSKYQRNLDWFNFWLQDKEDPNPEKQDQYIRWRGMRDHIKRNNSNNGITRTHSSRVEEVRPKP